MNNNRLCNILGIAGCTISAFCLAFMFFGATVAIWPGVAGVILAGLGLVNYN